MSAASPDPGRLSRRLVLEAPEDTPDGAGGFARSFEQVTILWAEVAPVRAAGGLVADARGATVTHRITVRAGRAITTRHRLRDGSQVFAIVAVRDADATRRFLAIDAQERTD